MAVKLFSYQRGTSLLHRAPALAKIIFLIAFCIFLFADEKTPWGIFFFVKHALCFIAAALIFFSSESSAGIFLELKPVLLIGIFVTAFRSVNFSPLSFSIEGLNDGLAYTYKFLLSSFCASIVFRTTSSLQIKDALDSVQDRLPLLKKLNPALMLSLTISFIPMVFETWNKVSLAAKARTPDAKKGFPKIRILYAEFSALFSCLLYRAETTRKALVNRSSF